MTRTPRLGPQWWGVGPQPDKFFWLSLTKKFLSSRKRNQHSPSLKLTASPLKMDGWNTTFLLGRPISEAMLVSGRVISHSFLSFQKPEKTLRKTHHSVAVVQFSQAMDPQAASPCEVSFTKHLAATSPFELPRISHLQWGFPQTETTNTPGGEPVGACMYVEKILLHIDFKYFRVGAKDILEKRKLQGFCIQFESCRSSKFPGFSGSQRINCTL